MATFVASVVLLLTGAFAHAQSNALDFDQKSNSANAFRATTTDEISLKLSFQLAETSSRPVPRKWSEHMISAKRQTHGGWNGHLKVVQYQSELGQSDTGNSYLTLSESGTATAAPLRGSAFPAHHNLDRLVANAIQSHPAISAKRAELGATQAEAEASSWQFFPSPSIQASRTKGTTATVFAIQQPLWAGGRLTAGMDAANSRVDSAAVAVTDAQHTLALRIASAFQAWRQAKGRSEALLKSIAQLEDYAAIMRRRIEGGVSADVDSELVAARLAQTRGDLASVRATERSALAQISQMTGQSLGSEDLTTTNEYKERLPALAAIVRQAETRSPSLRRIDADIETAQHEVAQKRAAFWPTLALRVEHQKPGTTTIGQTGADNRIMFVLDYAPGAGLSSKSGVDAAEARVGGLRESREAARRDLLEKINADYEEYQSSRSRKRDLLHTLNASTEVLASYSRLYVAGKRSWLDVLNAARELTQVEISLADIDALQEASLYRLHVYSGDLPAFQR